MLRSIARHFNETVFRGPDNEGGSDVENVLDTGGSDDGGGADAGGGDAGGEGSESDPQEKLTVREQLKRSIAEAAEDDKTKAAKPKKDKTSGRFQAKEPAAAAPAAEPAPVPVSATPAPADLPADAKAEWDKTPPAMQAAFIKRGQDMERGVQELKQRYNLIDQAIAPHQDALRQMNATPGDAVNRMFLWFKALAGNPKDSFPELAKSMGVDWQKLMAATGGAPAAAAGTQVDPAAATGAPEIPEPVKNYMGQLEKQVQTLTQMVNQVGSRFGSVEQNIQTQNMARTQENLSMWSKDKPYFEEVRQDMARMLETGIVPLKDGQVDLDTAYERAIYFNPTVRGKVLAAQQQANTEVQQQSAAAATTAQQTQVNKSRKASVSLPATTTPGAGNGAGRPAKPGQKLSVRDSLKAAIGQLRDQ